MHMMVSYSQCRCFLMGNSRSGRHTRAKLFHLSSNQESCHEAVKRTSHTIFTTFSRLTLCPLAMNSVHVSTSLNSIKKLETYSNELIKAHVSNEDHFTNQVHFDQNNSGLSSARSHLKPSSNLTKSRVHKDKCHRCIRKLDRSKTSSVCVNYKDGMQHGVTSLQNKGVRSMRKHRTARLPSTRAGRSGHTPCKSNRRTKRRRNLSLSSSLYTVNSGPKNDSLRFSSSSSLSVSRTRPFNRSFRTRNVCYSNSSRWDQENHTDKNQSFLKRSKMGCLKSEKSRCCSSDERSPYQSPFIPTKYRRQRFGASKISGGKVNLRSKLCQANKLQTRNNKRRRSSSDSSSSINNNAAMRNRISKRPRYNCKLPDKQQKQRTLKSFFRCLIM